MTHRPTHVLTLLPALLGVLIALHAMPAHAVDPVELQNPQLEARYTALLHQFRCPVCQDESLADSPADAAGEMRAQIRRMLLAGKTDAEIKQYFVSRYSEFILFKPEYSLRDAWLWLLPFALLAAGIFIAVRIIRTRVALVDEETGDADDELAEPPPPARETPSRASRAADNGPAPLSRPAR